MRTTSRRLHSARIVRAARRRAIRRGVTVGVAALALGGCGSDAPAVKLPDGVVAKVGSVGVTKADFDAKLRAVVADSSQGRKLPDYQPPDFDACTTERAAGGQQSEDAAREQCRGEYTQIKVAAMRTALQGEWTRQEAERRKIRPTAAEYRDAIDRQKVARFRTEQGYQKYLRDSRRSDSGFRQAVREQLLVQLITVKVGHTAPRPSARAIAAYYAAHRKEFAKPERRNVLLILAETEADGRAALKAVRGGQDWGNVAKRYSIDPDTKDKGGELRGYARSDSSQELDRVVFSAPVGPISGPIKTQFGWYVVKIEKVVPPRQPSLAQSRGQIKYHLTTNRQQRAVQVFARKWDERFTRLSICADDYKVAACRNGPKTDPPPPTVNTTGSPPGSM